MKPDYRPDVKHDFNPNDPTSVLAAQELTREHSLFDGSQADAVIDCMYHMISIEPGCMVVDDL